MKLIVSLLLFISVSVTLFAQKDSTDVENNSIKDKNDSAMVDYNIFAPKLIHMSEKEIISAVEKLPSFAVYQDIFFITGVPLNEKITKTTADAAIQISFRQRLTRSVLPFKLFAYLTYTQKSFWDIFLDSSPFRDTNYNPGIGLGRYLVYKNQLAGAASIQLKHESNGRDEEESRSWNYLDFSAKYYFNPRLNVTGEFWIPFSKGTENNDLNDYKGLGQLSFNYISHEQKWWLSAELNQRKKFGNINTTLSLGYIISKDTNLYVFSRFYNGYAESLLNYNKYTMNIRVGICIKPDFYSIY